MVQQKMELVHWWLLTAGLWYKNKQKMINLALLHIHIGMLELDCNQGD